MLTYQSKGDIIPRSSPSFSQYKERDSGIIVCIFHLRKLHSQNSLWRPYLQFQSNYASEISQGSPNSKDSVPASPYVVFYFSDQSD